MKKAVVGLAAVFLLLGQGQTFAQGEWLDAPVGIRPDSPLYIIETIKDRLSLLFTLGNKAKAEKLVRLAEERLAEAEAMVTFKKAKIAEKVLKRYETNLEQAEKHLKRAEEKGENLVGLKEKLTEASLRHQAVLQNVLERVPEEAKPAVKRAMEVSQRGYTQAIGAVSKEKQRKILEKVKSRIPDFRKRVPKGLEKKLFPAEGGKEMKSGE